MSKVDAQFATKKDDVVLSFILVAWYNIHVGHNTINRMWELQWGSGGVLYTKHPIWGSN